MKKICMLLCMLVSMPALSKNVVDLTIFSFNRPLQLYALLESIKKYVTGLGTVTVIYRTSNTAYAQAYSEVHAQFPTVHFVPQGAHPQLDFKLLTLNSVFQSPHDYCMFAVDDNIVKDFVDLADCVDALEKTGAYGFHLRLGTNLRECYMHYCAQPLPPFAPIARDILMWQFGQGRLDWRYCNSVDMVIYRKKDIQMDLYTMQYSTPNQLEAAWSARIKKFLHCYGLCYTQSKVINIPLNIVQHDFNNRAMNSISPEQLLQLWQSGLKMDITPLHNIQNHAVHTEYLPTYLLRTIS